MTQQLNGINEILDHACQEYLLIQQDSFRMAFLRKWLMFQAWLKFNNTVSEVTWTSFCKKALGNNHTTSAYSHLNQLGKAKAFDGRQRPAY
jgi:hypothetical protein